MKKNCIVILIIFTVYSCQTENKYSLQSPDGNIRLVIKNQAGSLTFLQLYKGDTIINESPIGLLVDSVDFTENVSLTNYSISSFNETWETVNGKNKEVRNQFNEYKLTCLKNDLNNNYSYEIIIRCYNDGFAYRYFISGQDTTKLVTIADELTKLKFNKDFTFWAYNGEHHNLGPLKRSTNFIDLIRTPMVIETDQAVFICIHEAEIFRYTPFDLRTMENNYSIGFKQPVISDTTPLKTSWRTFMIGDNPGSLVESDLLVNLSEKCKIEETSWIKPGKAMWDWRVWGYTTEDGFTYGLNTASHKRFIDFASENNIQYLLIDADWYGPEFSTDSDPTAAREGINIEECMAYAKKKNIGIILYLNDVGAKEFGLERVLKQFSDWGAIGIKYGFMKGTLEEKVRHTRTVIELCAKYKLMVDFHDYPVKPGGDWRTWPNLMAKEYCHAQADAKRSYFPETAVTAPFVNMIAGPLDMTNGWFDLNNAQSRIKVFEEIPGTVVAEVAKLIIVYTGWMVLPDSPEEYLKKDDLFDCIRKMPSQFDSFKVLDGKIGEYIIVARQAGNDWFIGSLTNRNARTIELDFSFLPTNRTYAATLYEDGETSHFMNNKESYQVQNKEIDSNSKITIKLGAGGGNAIYLKDTDHHMDAKAK